MAFVWVMLDSVGGAVGRSGEFVDAEAAEAWLAGSWADLLGTGVESVALHDGTAERYRMSLREAEPDDGGS
jgi:hypothetical protein